MLNVAVLATGGTALAAVRYVNVNNPNATPPYITWTTAATNIQDAVDAAVAGDEVVVTWPLAEGVREANCVRCFFWSQDAVARERARYTRDFGNLLWAMAERWSQGLPPDHLRGVAA